VCGDGLVAGKNPTKDRCSAAAKKNPGGGGVTAVYDERLVTVPDPSAKLGTEVA